MIEISKDFNTITDNGKEITTNPETVYFMAFAGGVHEYELNLFKRDHSDAKSICIDVDGGSIMSHEFLASGDLLINWINDSADKGSVEMNHVWTLPFAIHREDGAFSLTIYQL